MKKSAFKRIFSLFLCLCMIIPAAASAVWAEEGTGDQAVSGAVNLPDTGRRDFELPDTEETVWSFDFASMNGTLTNRYESDTYGSVSLSTSNFTLAQEGMKLSSGKTNGTIRVNENVSEGSKFSVAAYDKGCLILRTVVNFKNFPQTTTGQQILSFITWEYKYLASETATSTSTEYARFLCIDEYGRLYNNSRALMSETKTLPRGKDTEICIVMDPDPTVCGYDLYLDGEYVFSGTVPVRERIQSSCLRVFDTNRNYSGVVCKSVSLSTVDEDYKRGDIETADWAAYQTTEIVNNTFNVRLLSLVNSRKLAAVGYEVTAAYYENGLLKTKTRNISTDTVYTEINQTVDGEHESWRAADNGGKYILALSIDGVDASLEGMQLEVRPYSLAEDGSKVYGESRYMRYDGVGSNGYPTFSVDRSPFDSVVHIPVTEDTYVRFGSNRNNDYFSASSLEAKWNSASTDVSVATSDSNSNTRIPFLYFDLSGITDMEATYELKLNFKSIDTRLRFDLYTVDASKLKSALGTSKVTLAGLTGSVAKDNASTLLSTSGHVATFSPQKEWVTVDITDCVREALVSGKTDLILRPEYKRTDVKDKVNGNTGYGYAIIYAEESGIKNAAYITTSGTMFFHERELSTSQNTGFEPWGYAERIVDDWYDNIFDIYAREYTANAVSDSTNAADFTKSIKIASAYPSAENKTWDAQDWKNSAKSTALRTVSTVKGFTALSDTATIEYDLYGGYAADGGKYYTEAYRDSVNGTPGFFGTYHDKINDRWWYITPEGNRFLAVGMCTVTNGSTTAQKALAQTAYDSLGKTHNEFVTELFNEYGLNTATGSVEPLYDETDGSYYNVSKHTGVSLISTYAKELGLNVSIGGSTIFKNNNTLNVFDPDFVTYAYARALKEIGESKNEPGRMGWTSDNEIPADKDMLKRYLTLDPTDPLNAYSYATAWTWLRVVTGKVNPCLEDSLGSMTVNMGGVSKAVSYYDLFRGFVYYRYYAVASGSIKNADSNHLYLGCRELANNYQSETVMRVAGNFCDVITLNLYLGANPSSSVMSNLYTWTGKPAMVTEFYAKALGTDDKLNPLESEHQSYGIWEATYPALPEADSSAKYYTVDRIVTTVKGVTATDTYYDGDIALWKIEYSGAGVTAGTREAEISAYIPKNSTEVKAYFLADGKTQYRDADGTVKTAPLFILNSTRGAGKVVLTQEDRAIYYQTFALKMLEAGNCIGWSWYRYQDNDMAIYWDTVEGKYVENNMYLQRQANAGTLDTTRYVKVHQGETDQSNLDSNKGIVDNRLNVYVDFAEGIGKITRNMFALVDFIDTNRR